jgi:site-specific recombinase XerD
MNGDLTLEELSRSWARYLRAEYKSPRTVRLYMDGVRYFARWCEEHDAPATLASLNRDLVLGYFEDSAATRKPGTALTRYRHLRVFCAFLVAEGDVEVSPMAGMSPPKVPEEPVPVFTEEELAALVKAARSERRPFDARRDEAMIRMFVDGGPRISELARMLLDECDLDAGAAWVTGKGSRRRTVMFGSKTGRALDRYLRVRRTHRHAANPALWLTQRGGMSKDGCDYRLELIAERAGVEDVRAHRFRHTWAHDYLAAGGGEQNLKRLAGWRSDAMLARYGASQIYARARAEHARLARGDRL